MASNSDGVENEIWSAVGGKGDSPKYTEVVRWAREHYNSRQSWGKEVVHRVRVLLEDIVPGGEWCLSFDTDDEIEVTCELFLPEPDSLPPRIQEAVETVKELGGVVTRQPGAGIRFTMPRPVMMKVLTTKSSARMSDMPKLKHPLSPMVMAYAKRPRMGAARRVDHISLKGGGKFTKMPSAVMLALAPARDVMVIRSEGEPLVSPTAKAYDKERWSPSPCGQLDAFPRTLAGNATGDIVLKSLAGFHSDGRSTIKADLLAISSLVFALTHPAEVSARDLMRLFGWRESENNFDRLNRAVYFARGMSFDLGDGPLRYLFDINVGQGKGLDAIYHLAAGPWWRGGSSKGKANAWRLSGILFQHSTSKTGKLTSGYWGTAQRFLSGVEAALQGGATSGKGRGGRTSDWLKAERRGGPGPGLNVPAWQALALAGRCCDEELYRTRSAHRACFGRLIATLKNLGYVCDTPSTAAEAGGTVEVVKVHSGRGQGLAGLTVRATARLVAVAAVRGNSRRWDSLPLDTLIGREK